MDEVVTPDALVCYGPHMICPTMCSYESTVGSWRRRKTPQQERYWSYGVRSNWFWSFVTDNLTKSLGY